MADRIASNNNEISGNSADDVPEPSCFSPSLFDGKSGVDGKVIQERVIPLLPLQVLRDRFPARSAYCAQDLDPRFKRDCVDDYLGVASGRPPSTGMVAPVEGVWRVAKNRTALATCLAVMRALRRLRLR